MGPGPSARVWAIGFSGGEEAHYRRRWRAPHVAAAEDKEGEFSKPMQQYRGTPRMALQNHQVRRPGVSQPWGQA